MNYGEDRTCHACGAQIHVGLLTEPRMKWLEARVPAHGRAELRAYQQQRLQQAEAARSAAPPPKQHPPQPFGNVGRSTGQQQQRRPPGPPPRQPRLEQESRPSRGERPDPSPPPSWVRRADPSPPRSRARVGSSPGVRAGGKSPRTAPREQQRARHAPYGQRRGYGPSTYRGMASAAAALPPQAAWIDIDEAWQQIREAPAPQPRQPAAAPPAPAPPPPPVAALHDSINVLDEELERLGKEEAADRQEYYRIYTDELRKQGPGGKQSSARAIAGGELASKPGRGKRYKHLIAVATEKKEALEARLEVLLKQQQQLQQRQSPPPPHPPPQLPPPPQQQPQQQQPQQQPLPSLSWLHEEEERVFRALPPPEVTVHVDGLHQVGEEGDLEVMKEYAQMGDVSALYASRSCVVFRLGKAVPTLSAIPWRILHAWLC